MADGKPTASDCDRLLGHIDVAQKMLLVIGALVLFAFFLIHQLSSEVRVLRVQVTNLKSYKATSEVTIEKLEKYHEQREPREQREP